MKISSVAVFAAVSASSPWAVSSFAPVSANQKYFSAMTPQSTASSTSRQAMSMGFGEVLLGASISLATSLAPLSVAPTVSDVPSITIARSSDDITSTLAVIGEDPVKLKSAEKQLLKEVKEAERKAKAEQKAAQMELRRAAYFEYDAKAAADEEARTEALEKRFAAKAKKDEAQVQWLIAQEKKAEEAAAKAATKEEKAELLAEAKRLAKAEKAAEKKAREDERAERIYLAEEAQERKRVDTKMEAALAEETKFYNYERAYEKDLAKEQQEESELKVLKDLEAKIGVASAKKR